MNAIQPASPMTSAAPAPARGCRVRIIDDIHGKTIDLETPRSKSEILTDLTHLTNCINGCDDGSLQANLALNIAGGFAAVLRLHCPRTFTIESDSQLFEFDKCFGDVEKLVMEGL